MFQKCGEWTHLFATTVANGKILLDIDVLRLININKYSELATMVILGVCHTGIFCLCYSDESGLATGTSH